MIPHDLPPENQSDEMPPMRLMARGLGQMLDWVRPIVQTETDEQLLDGYFQDHYEGLRKA